MKYEIKGIKKEETIKDYKITNGNIIVKYLDGSVKNLPYTAENEKLIVNKMLQQASYRESELYQTYMANKSDNSSNMLLPLVFGTGFISLLSLYVSQLYELGFIPLICATVAGYNYSKSIRDENEDIEKYHIYLEMKETIEKILSSELNAGTNNLLSNLNINTIDKFSLSDLKRISKDLKAIDREFLTKNYNSQFEQNTQQYVGKFAKTKSKIR